MKQIIRFIGICCSIICTPRLSKITTALANQFYTGLRKRFFAQWGDGSTIAFQAKQLIGLEHIKVGRLCTLHEGIQLTAWSTHNRIKYTPSITIGDHCVFGANSHITAINKITIGNSLLTGTNILISDNIHTIGKDIGGNEDYIHGGLTSKGAVTIEDNVWLGNNVCVLAGVTIGANSIIGANSVVTHSIPPNTIAAGTPARIIKSIDK